MILPLPGEHPDVLHSWMGEIPIPVSGRDWERGSHWEWELGMPGKGLGIGISDFQRAKSVITGIRGIRGKQDTAIPLIPHGQEQLGTTWDGFPGGFSVLCPSKSPGIQSRK